MAVALNYEGLLNYLLTQIGFSAVTTQFSQASIPWRVTGLAWDDASSSMGCRYFAGAVSASGYPQPRIYIPGQGAGQSARYYSQRVWASFNDRRVLLADEEGSHLCWNKRCINRLHVRAEKGDYNKSRDTCRMFLLDNLEANFDNLYRCCHKPACLYAVHRAGGLAPPNAFHAYP